MAALDAESKVRPISGIETFHGWSAPKAIAAMDQGGVELVGCGFTDAELAGVDRENALRLLPQFRT